MLHINTLYNAVRKTSIAILVLLIFLSCVTNVKADVDSLIHKQNSIVIDSLKQLLTKPLPDTLRVDIKTKLAIELAHNHMALNYIKEALDLCNQIKDNKRKHEVLKTYGNFYFLINNYSQALFYYLQSLRICEALNMGASYEAPLLNNIGICYVRLKQYDIAKTYLLKILYMAKDSTLLIKNSVLVNVNQNMGVIEGIRNNFNASLFYFKQALRLSETQKSARIYHNIAETYLRLNQLKLTLAYLNRAFPLIQDNMEDLITYYHKTGEVYLKQGNIVKAQDYFFKAKAIAETSETISALGGIYASITVMYEQKGDFKNAYLYHQKYKALQDSSLNEYTSKKIAELQESYELEKRDNEIMVLSQKKQIAEEKVNNQLLAGILLLSGLIIVLAISRNTILKQRIKNKALSEEKAITELQKQQTEKDNMRLLHENTEAKYEVLKSKVNPHFLFNSLTTLSSLIVEDQKKPAIEYVQRFSELYRMTLKTGEQKLIPFEEEMKVLEHYLYLQKMRFRDDFVVDIMLPEDFNPKAFSLPPFALQMVVENAIKHNVISDESRLFIHLWIEDDTIVVKNNLQKKEIQLDSTATGQKNIIARYQAITLRKPVFINTGAEYIVKLPLVENYPSEVFNV